MGISRRGLLKLGVLGAIGLGAYGSYRWMFGDSGLNIEQLTEKIPSRDDGGPSRPPNIVFIYADDLGYGDLGCYGAAGIRTPNIDSLAAEGMRFTDFYSCNALCTPARYGFLTGRYPQRSGLIWPLWPEKQPIGRKAAKLFGHVIGKFGLSDMGSESNVNGMPGGEITLAEVLRSVGYRTALVGKWHLGDFPEMPEYHPQNHGFDEFFGVPYSNGNAPLPLYRNKTKIADNIQGQEQARFSRLYAEESIKFIKKSKDQPFFLYLAHTFPHRPLFASDEFRHKSKAGLYGDVVEELDHYTGLVLDSLKEMGLEDNTIVIFTSDNGPWYYGSTGGLRGGKGQSFEGGFRIPMLVKWPGKVKPGSTSKAPAMIIDMFPTLTKAAGVKQPDDRIIDGKDITGLITGEDDRSPHEVLYFYHHDVLEGIRAGQYKYYRKINLYKYPMPVNKVMSKVASGKLGKFPLLYDLERDPSESYNLADNMPDLVDKMEAIMNNWEARMMANAAGKL